MPVYQYEGKHYDLPEGLTNEQAISKIETYLGKTPTAPATAPVTTQPQEPQEAPSMVSQMFGMGSPIARFAKGAIVDPLLAANQMLAQTGIFGEGIKKGATQTVQQYEQATQQARAAMGSEGFDPYQLAGGILSPVGKAAVGKTVGAVASPLAKAAVTGATYGALEPVRGGDFLEQKAAQVGVGAVAGPLFEGTIKLLGQAGNIVKGLTPSGREKALRSYLDGLAGPDKTQVISALQDARELVRGSRPTVAEVLADIPTAAELAAVQKQLSSNPKLAGAFKARSAEQQAARESVVQGIAKTDAERQAVEASRKSVFKDIGAKALDMNNQARVALDEISKVVTDGYKSLARAQLPEEMAGKGASPALVDLLKGTPAYKSTSMVSREAASLEQLKKFQLDSLAQNGFFPLKATDIAKPLDKALKGTVSDEAKLVLQGVKDDIMSKADGDGIINSYDLYENVRKVLNQKISTYLNTGDKPFQGGIPQNAARVADDVKAIIDATLDKSSGGLWSDYLKKYGEHSAKLDRMAVGTALAKKLNSSLDVEKAGAFAQAVEESTTSLIKKSTGLPRYEKIEDILTPKESAAVRAVVADLQRQSRATQLMKGVKQGEGIQEGVKAPPLLSRAVTIFNAAMEHIQRGDKAKFDAKMAELYLDPKAMADFISNVPVKKSTGAVKTEVQIMLDAISKFSPQTSRNLLQAMAVRPLVGEASKQPEGQ